MRVSLSLFFFLVSSFQIFGQNLNLFSNTVLQGAPYLTAITEDVNGNYLIGNRVDHVDNIRTGNLVKIKNSGKLNETFNKVFVNDHILKVMTLPNGKILIGGGFNKVNGANSAHIVRLNSDGSIDPSFSAWTGMESYYYIGDFDIQSDGKIIMGGDFNNYDNTGYNDIVRLNEDGTIDNTFKKNQIDIPYVARLTIDSDDNIYSTNGADISKLKFDGSFDSNFNTSGTTGYFYQLKVVTGGKLLVAGQFSSFGGVDIENIARLNLDGTTDLTFAGSDFTPNTVIYGMDVFLNGRIVITGSNLGSINNIQTNVAILDSNGAFFKSLAPASFYGERVFVDKNQNTVLLGQFENSSKRYTARFKEDYTLDETFAPVLSQSTGIRSMTVQSDRKVLLAGAFSGINSIKKKSIYRINTDGSLDDTFSAPDSPVQDIYCLAVQSDQKILVGGYNLIRLLPTGAIDNGFLSGFSASQGTLITDVKLESSAIYVAGSFFGYPSFESQGIIKLKEDGTVNNTFKSLLPTNSSVTRFDFQHDGKIIVVGYFPISSGIKNILRLNTDGSIDNTFEQAVIDFNGIWSIKIDPTDRIYFGGGFFKVNGENFSKVARLKKDGALDFGFFPSPFFNYNSAVYSIEILSENEILMGSNYYINSYESGKSLALYDQSGQLLSRPYVTLNSNSSIEASFFDGLNLYLAGRLLNQDGTQVAPLASTSIFPVQGNITNLQASAVTTASATLTWTNNFSKAYSIILERSTQDHLNYSVIQTTPIDKITTADNELSEATYYYYRIKAINSYSTSAYSNEVLVTTKAMLPTAEVASDIKSTSFKANWSFSGTSDFYLVQVSSDNFATFLPGYENLKVTQLASEVVNLAPNSSYKYRIKRSKNGIESDFSNAISLSTLPNPPEAPSDVKINLNGFNFELSWKDNSTNETGFIVERSIGTDGAFQVLATLEQNVVMLTDKALELNKIYFYRVKARNTGGDSPFSSIVSLEFVVGILEFNQGVTFYPNPISDYLFFSANSDFKVEIFSLDGEIVTRREYKNIANSAIDLRELSSELYIIVLTTKKQSEVKRLLKISDK